MCRGDHLPIHITEKDVKQTNEKIKKLMEKIRKIN